MKKYLLSLLSIAMLASCSKSDKARISGKIDNFGGKYLLIYNADKPTLDTLYMQGRGTFDQEFDAGTNPIHTILLGQDILEVYLENGKDLTINTSKSAFMKAEFGGDLAEEAEVMQKKLAITSGVDARAMSKLDPVAYTEQMDATDAKIAKIVDDSGINSDLKELLKSDAFFTLLPQRDGFGMSRGNIIHGADSAKFYAYKDRVKEEVNNPANLNSTAFRMYVYQYVNREIKRNHIEELRASGTNWLTLTFDLVPEFVQNDEVKDFVYYSFYNRVLSTRMAKIGITDLKPIYESYMSYVKNDKWKENFENEYQAYLKTLENAPKVEATEESVE